MRPYESRARPARRCMPRCALAASSSATFPWASRRGLLRGRARLQVGRTSAMAAGAKSGRVLASAQCRKLRGNRCARCPCRTKRPLQFHFLFRKNGAARRREDDCRSTRVRNRALYEFLHGADALQERFEAWVQTVDGLPRRQTRVLTWPLVTVFGFLAQPSRHIFVKPTVTRAAVEAYGYPLPYRSRPSWETYGSLLKFARILKQDLRDLRPRDMIDIQSFLWVQGSDEYS